MLTMFLMRRTAQGARRDREGIRWRGINWDREEPKVDRFAEAEDHLRKSQD